MKRVWNDKAQAKDRQSFVGLEFDYIRLPNPIQINRTIEVRLSSITQRSIGVFA